MDTEKNKEEEVDLMTLPEAAKAVGYTPEYLNMLARKKKLQAMKIGRNWFTTQAWLNDFFHPELKVSGAVSAEPEEVRSNAVPDVSLEQALDPGTAETDLIFKAAPEVEKAKKQAGTDIAYVLESEEYPGRQKNSFFEFFKLSGTLPRGKYFREKFFKFRSAKKLESDSSADYENGFPREDSARGWQSPKIFSAAVVLILIFLGTMQAINVKQIMDKNNLGAGEQSLLETGKIEMPGSAEEEGAVLGTETENSSRVLLASENYAIKEIKFGGDVSLLASSYENFPLSLTDVHSQVVTTKNKDEMQLLVYWKTNKLALSKISYSKMGADSTRKISEDDFGFSHSVIIPGLAPATAYVYVISVKDKWGNTITSDRYSAYTGARNVSVFELIAKTMEETFGWAMKK